MPPAMSDNPYDTPAVEEKPTPQVMEDTQNPEVSAAEQAKMQMLAEINRLAETSEKNDAGKADEADQSVTAFKVTNPQKIGKTVKYTVSGRDSEGDFEVIRRYNEFDALRTVLSIRWPGCYIPFIPEKKLDIPDISSGKMDSGEAKFIEERKTLL